MKAGNVQDISAPPLTYEELLAQVVESSHEGVLAKNLQGRYFYANPAAAAMLGRGALDIVGRTDTDLFGPEIARRLGETDAAALAGRPDATYEAAMNLGGKARIIAFTKGALRKRDGRAVGVLTLVREVDAEARASERRGAEAVHSELERLREMDRIKTQFINHTAHELSTPLTPIKLQLHLLKTTTARTWNEQERRSLEILERNFERLATLVGDVLDASRLQAGRLGVQRQPLDVGPLVREAHDSFRALYDQNRIRLTCGAPDGLFVDGDPMRLSQVLFNFLHNAQKFTPAGGEVRIEARRHKERIVVEVQDSGAGLTSEQIQHLFQPFSQVHDTSQKTRAGTGLGLFISKGIVELHGGHVSVRTEGPGRGSTFGFQLAARDVPRDRAALEVTKSTQSLAKGEFQRRVHELV